MEIAEMDVGETADPQPHQLLGPNVLLSILLLMLYVISAVFRLAVNRHARRKRQREAQVLNTLPPSPPPLARLSELEEQAPVPLTTRTPTPPFSISKTIKRTADKRPQSITPSPLTATTGVSSPYEASPYGCPSVDVEGTPAANQAASPQKGWDPALLQQCAQNEAHICSLDGLLRSSELQQHVRSTTSHQNFDLHLQQADARLRTYRDLRAFDRDNFVQAYTRKDIKDFDELPPPRALLVVDLASSTVLMGSLLLSWLHGSLHTPGLLLVWTVLQALLAWRASHPSLVACTASIYCVYGDDRYAAHQVAAGPVRTALAALLDLLLVCCSLGVSSLVSAALVCALPLRQTLGQRLMRIYPVEEVARPVETPLYAGSPSKLTSRDADDVARSSPTTKQVLRGPMLSPPPGRTAPPTSSQPGWARSSRLSQPPPPHPPSSTRLHQHVTPETQMQSQMRSMHPPSQPNRPGQPHLVWEELAAFSASRSLPRSPINKRKHD